MEKNTSAFFKKLKCYEILKFSALFRDKGKNGTAECAETAEPYLSKDEKQE